MAAWLFAAWLFAASAAALLPPSAPRSRAPPYPGGTLGLAAACARSTALMAILAFCVSLAGFFAGVRYGLVRGAGLEGLPGGCSGLRPMWAVGVP